MDRSPCVSIDTICGRPSVSVPVLSRISVLIRASASKRFCALDQHPEMRGSGQARHQRHRYGKDKRARCGDHQNRNCTDRVSGEPPSGEGDHHGHEQEAQRPAVGQTGHRGFGGLRLFDQADDSCIGAVLRLMRGREIEGVACIGRTAHGLAAIGQSYGQRLACQRRGIEKSRRGSDRAIHGDDVALPDQKAIAGHDVVERYLFELPVLVPCRGSWHAREDRASRAARDPRRSFRGTCRRNT